LIMMSAERCLELKEVDRSLMASLPASVFIYRITYSNVYLKITVPH
jgi:hypothetical protein